MCLAEKTGNEGKLVNEYERYVTGLREEEEGHEKQVGSSVKYLGWDFHRECKGMHYERVSQLVDEGLDDMLKHGSGYCSIHTCFRPIYH